jgi:glycine hydroxymethyltransferase
MAANPSITTVTSPRSLPLSRLDPDAAAAVGTEPHRRQPTLEMTASENLAPAAVMEAQGPVPTDKYAGGHPGRRCYGGCEHVGVTALTGRFPRYAGPTGHAGRKGVPG